MEQITMVQVEHLHPHEHNPRIDAASVADLVESIRENGIRVPLAVAPREDGDGYTVVAGHRRLVAAHGLGLTEVPAQIDAALTDPREQMKFMMLENILRRGLSPMEESRAVQAALDLGMTQASVAKQTGLGKKWVADRAKLSKVAEETGTKIHDGQISIDEALIIAEYSDDPDTVEELENSVGSFYFDSVASRARARREGRKQAEAAKKQAKKDGVRVVDEDADFVSLLELNNELMWTTLELDALAPTHPDDDEWNRALAVAHADCPGHCLLITESGPWAGESLYGCDQVATRHDPALDSESAGGEPSPEPEPEREPDPLDRFTPEDMQTMRYDRESKVHTALTTTDLTDWALAELTARAATIFTGFERLTDGPEYRAAALGFLGLPGTATDAAAIKAVKQLSWPARYAFVQYGRTALFHHLPMAGSARAWMWATPEQNHLDDFLRAVGAEPSDLEKELRTLRGHPWDKPTADGAALAEGGEAA